jgi:hypothetical protein
MTTYNTGIVSSRTIFSRDVERAQSIVTVSSVPQLHYNRGKITSTAGSTRVEAAITPLVRCYTASASTSDGSLLPPKTYCPTSDEITYVGTGGASGSFRLEQPSRSLPAQNTPAGVALETADSSNPLINIGEINSDYGYTGAGTGMTVTVQLLYPKTTAGVDEPFFVATIVNPGTGYLPGETFTVSGVQCETGDGKLGIFSNYSGAVTSPTWNASVVFTITEANFYSGGGGIDRLTPALSEFDVGREIVSSGSGKGAVLTYVNGNDLTFDYNGESGTGLQHGTFLALSSRNEGLPSNRLTAEVPEIPGAGASGATFEITSDPPNPPTCRVLSPGTGYRVGQTLLFAQADLIAAGFQFGGGGVAGSMFFVVEPGDLQLDFQNLQSFVLSPPRGGTVFVANTQTSPPFGGDFPSSLVGETIEAAGQKRQIVSVTGYTKLLIDRPFDPPLVGPTRYSITWVPPTPSLPSGLIGGTIEANGQTKTIERSWESRENTASLDTWKRFPPNRHVIVTSTPFVPPLDKSSYTIRSA